MNTSKIITREENKNQLFEMFFCDLNENNPNIQWKFISKTRISQTYSQIEAGNWIELYENQKGDQIIFFGRYENYKKENLWQTYYCLKSSQEFVPIGGGLYKQGVKIGSWIEVLKSFQDYDELIIYSGIYSEGKRIDFWDIQVFGTQTQEKLKIGGGYYDNINGFKIGYWIELYIYYDKECQVILTGEYQNGIKQGYWRIKQKQQFEYKYYEIGGGQYNKKGQMIGKWIELHENFDNLCQVVYQGEYIDGNKIGIWNAYCNNQIRSHGFYDFFGKQVGKWIELYDNYYNENQLIQIGNYEKGKKSKDWIIMMKIKRSNTFIKIGGGIYNIDGLKIGLWVEPNYNFYEDSQIINVGDYENGIKIGNWEIYYRNNENMKYQSIGEGNYSREGVKIGKWNELSISYFYDRQLIYCGMYENGKKNGRWQTKFKKQQEEFKIIGEGNYSNNLKEGKWFEPIEYFTLYNQVFFDGQYKNNKKLGKWNIYYKQSSENQYYLIGGGDYEEEYGAKDGIWNEIKDISNFNQETSVITNKYKNGMILYPIKKQSVI